VFPTTWTYESACCTFFTRSSSMKPGLGIWCHASGHCFEWPATR